ncbi:ATP-binding protein, partial [Streptomyces albus]|uniref:ATP-binding protein n=1 Tax=Streptomyces albus TaxID=1888 RepID=UPI001FDAA80C
MTLKTRSLDEALRQLRLTLLVNNRHRGTARRGLIVSGPPGAGKSTTLMELGRAFERSERTRRPGHADCLPVVFAAIPPTCTPKGLVKEFARFLGIPVHDRMTETVITDAVCDVIVARRTRLVFLDDVHLLNTRTRPGADSSDPRFLGIPVHDRMTETVITDAVCDVIVARRTRLVFLDDVHLLNTRTRPGADSSD